MEIIPAIDILGGRCARLTKGNYRLKSFYSKNPLRLAQFFQEKGFKKIHLIDLDGARAGKVVNWPVIEEIVEKTNLVLQAGGGFQTLKDIKRLLNLGRHQIICGTIILRKPRKFKDFLKKFGNKKIIADTGVKNEEIYIRGWQEKTKERVEPFLQKLIQLGVKTVVCTDINRDGTMNGPNFSLYEKLVREFPKLKIIASGGIRNKTDLKRLSRIGVQGAVIGKAIYEKKISLENLKPYL